MTENEFRVGIQAKRLENAPFYLVRVTVPVPTLGGLPEIAVRGVRMVNLGLLQAAQSVVSKAIEMLEDAEGAAQPRVEHIAVE